jgi:hypothetical protein
VYWASRAEVSIESPLNVLVSKTELRVSSRAHVKIVRGILDATAAED